MLTSHLEQWFHAAEKDDSSSLQYFLWPDFDIDARNEKGETALHVAARLNHCETAEFLLIHGAKIEARDDSECTPLLLAALWGHVKMIRFLLAKGADMYACDDSEWHMLHWIAHENNLTLFDEIKNSLVSLVLSTRWNGVTSLYMASSAEMVTRLITLGVPMEAVTDYGDTVLLEAIFQGDTQVALCLIDRGANVLHVDHTGKTALDIANERGNFVIKQAIEKRLTREHQKDRKKNRLQR
jgi:ankyrin repeat protein